MDINLKSINSLRVLATEMIENANSGHPGIVLGMTPLMYLLYGKILNTSPNSSENILRDRFVLSAGHGSAMLYSALHAFGYDYSLDDLKAFRQINSITPGHPEVDVKRGVEASTGPLGQGVANAVGMAIAQSYYASVFNKKNIKLFDNYTYSLAGDGCMMEGVSYEALSLAGTLKLDKLIVFYDSNKITIDGGTDLTFRQNTVNMYKALGFYVQVVKDANNLVEIERAIKKAKKSGKPNLIVLNSVIGFGSLVAGSNKAHGSPLGKDGLSELKKAFSITETPFYFSDDVKNNFDKLKERFAKTDKSFTDKIKFYKENYPKDYEKLTSIQKQKFTDIDKILNRIKIDKKAISTRDLSSIVLNALADKYDSIIGGTADLSSSTKAYIKNSEKHSSEKPYGKNIMYGIREFAMSAITNGISLYGGLVPFASTFLVFSDYMRAGIRVGALSHLKSIYVLTHDSIGVGEDGPTHQPIEHINSFRIMPNVIVYRPFNLQEVCAGYKVGLTNNKPTLLILTRQNINTIESSLESAEKGGYVLSSEKSIIDCVIISSGSEVEIALQAQSVLNDKGIYSRVVSMPSIELFRQQDKKYQNSVLPKNTPVFVVEAGNITSWLEFTEKENIIGINTFGKSGDIKDVYNDFGITYKDLVKLIQKRL